MIVAVVTGTRRNTRLGAVSNWLDEVDPRIVVMGCCNVRLDGYGTRGPIGVDAEAHAWCLRKGRFPVICQAPWEALGSMAGPERNGVLATIADKFDRIEDVVHCAAFPDAESRGTWDAIRKLKAVGFDVPTPGWKSAT